ncbi:MAG: peptidase M3, partial [Alphaproteobacteria bacterium]|nr:peptidase M3 [Alphaproteobacteria bacterium]
WLCWSGAELYRDSRDTVAQERRARAGAIRTVLAELQTPLKARLLADHREALGRLLAPRILARWEGDARSFTPAIADLRRREEELVTEYQRLQGSARVPFDGEELPLGRFQSLFADPDRDVRERSMRAYWGWFAEQRESLDALYGELVDVRTRMAHGLSDPDYTPLAYRRMGRPDWGPAEAAVFRQEILEHVVPLVAAYRRDQAEALGVDRVRLWDEETHGTLAPPRPIDLETAIGPVLSGFSAELGAQYAAMHDRGLLDLFARDGKAPGGFTTWFEGGEWPFVFMNAGGAASDVTTLVHEMGHAFQIRTSSLVLPRHDERIGSAETSEVHSMSLELLVHPHVGGLFASPDDAVAYRHQNLLDALTVLPYTAAIDAFQHDVYAHPDATPDERAGFWKDAERAFLPWRDEPDLPHVSDGRTWQRQGHVFFAPFYYLDYALARVMALQLWHRSLTDADGAREAWLQLCRVGGRPGLADMAQIAAVRSPFEPGCLADVTATLRDHLGL